MIKAVPIIAASFNELCTCTAPPLETSHRNNKAPFSPAYSNGLVMCLNKTFILSKSTIFRAWQLVLLCLTVLFFLYTHIINCSLRAVQSPRPLRCIDQRAGWILLRWYMQHFHQLRGLWCMTLLGPGLMNDLTEAHTTSLGPVRGRDACGEKDEREWRIWGAEHRSSRWCWWQVWSSPGVTLHTWLAYSDCTTCDISALISATHHTTRRLTARMNDYRSHISKHADNIWTVRRLKLRNIIFKGLSVGL